MIDIPIVPGVVDVDDGERRTGSLLLSLKVTRNLLNDKGFATAQLPIKRYHIAGLYSCCKFFGKISGFPARLDGFLFY